MRSAGRLSEDEDSFNLIADLTFVAVVATVGMIVTLVGHGPISPTLMMGHSDCPARGDGGQMK